jgi:hypothetical protein
MRGWLELLVDLWICAIDLPQIVTYDRNLQAQNRLRDTLDLPISALVKTENLPPYAPGGSMAVPK